VNIILKEDLFGDACCKRVYADGEYIGIWCKKSTMFSADGEVRGFFDSEDDIRKNLVRRTVKTVKWGRK
jgi:hypothetical protein